MRTTGGRSRRGKCMKEAGRGIAGRQCLGAPVEGECLILTLGGVLRVSWEGGEGVSVPRGIRSLTEERDLLGGTASKGHTFACVQVKPPGLQSSTC